MFRSKSLQFLVAVALSSETELGMCGKCFRKAISPLTAEGV